MSRTGVVEKLHEGWLTKSPPSNRFIRCRWRKRWFSLHCGELPGQYQLTYYTDRNCRKLKGVIDLDRCEQVDIGLKYEDRRLKFDHMLSIKTPARTYYLAADSEQEMKNWVRFICDVCNLKSSDEEETPYISSMSSVQPQVKETNADVPSANERQSSSSSTTTPTNSVPVTPISPTTSPYIHISECVTGRLPMMDGPSYFNISQDMCYDQPRSLQAPSSMANYCNLPPPPHSPTGSDTVFEEPHSTVPAILTTATQPADGTISDNATATQLMPPPPPRPPKPAAMPSPKPNYFNLKEISATGEKTIVQDDMYDFPRSHQLEGDATGPRHCYNNAAPEHSIPRRRDTLEGEIFTYDCKWSSKTGQLSDATNIKSEPSSNLEDSTTSDNPALPHTPTTPTSQNHSHPTTPNNISLPPVHRDLKPPPSAHRRLSESSYSGDHQTVQPGSPAPSVDRKKKPAKLLLPDVTLQGPQQVIRAAPSPQPPHSGGKSFEMLIHSDYKANFAEVIQQSSVMKLDYLVLDETVLGSGAQPSDDALRSPGTTYKVVDFVKTNAFNITRDNLEKEKLEKQHNTLALVNKK